MPTWHMLQLMMMMMKVMADVDAEDEDDKDGYEMKNNDVYEGEDRSRRLPYTLCY